MRHRVTAMEELCTAHVATFHRHFVGEKSTPETA